MFSNGMLGVGPKQDSWSVCVNKWQLFLWNLYIPRECVGELQRGLSQPGPDQCLPLTGGSTEPVGTSTPQPQLPRPRKEKGVGGRGVQASRLPGHRALSPGGQSWLIQLAVSVRRFLFVPVPCCFSCTAGSPETKLQLSPLLRGPRIGAKGAVSFATSRRIACAVLAGGPSHPFLLSFALPCVTRGPVPVGYRAQAPCAGPGISPSVTVSLLWPGLCSFGPEFCWSAAPSLGLVISPPPLSLQPSWRSGRSRVPVRPWQLLSPSIHS